MPHPPKNSPIHRRKSRSRVTRPMNSADGTPFRSFGFTPSRSAFSVSCTACAAAMIGWWPCRPRAPAGWRDSRDRRARRAPPPMMIGMSIAAAAASSCGAVLDADEEERIDPGRGIGLGARDGVLGAGRAHRDGPPDDDQIGILPRRERRAHLADAFLDRGQRLRRPAHRDAAAPCPRWSAPRRRRSPAPATVRMTLSALP